MPWISGPQRLCLFSLCIWDHPRLHSHYKSVCCFLWSCIVPYIDLLVTKSPPKSGHTSICLFISYGIILIRFTLREPNHPFLIISCKKASHFFVGWPWIFSIYRLDTFLHLWKGKKVTITCGITPYFFLKPQFRIIITDSTCIECVNNIPSRRSLALKDISIWTPHYSIVSLPIMQLLTKIHFFIVSIFRHYSTIASTCGGTEVLYYMAKVFSLHYGRVNFFVNFASLTPFEWKSPLCE